MATHLPSETYTTLAAKIQASRAKQEATIAPNTIARFEHASDVIRVTLHGNLIARIARNGVTWLSDAGWATQTTLRRLRALAPVGYIVWRHKGFTYIKHESEDDKQARRVDQAGVTVY